MSLALPGSGEPRLPTLDREMRAWLGAIARAVNTARLRADVEKMPAPRNRLHAVDAMQETEMYIADEFRAAGWNVESRAFTLTDAHGYIDYGDFMEAKIYPRLDGVNVLAFKEGADPGAAFVVLGHYDTVRDSPGANDNTGAVAAMLELARVLAPYRFHHSIVLAATDMEELNLFGAQALAPQLTRERRVLGVINFETMCYTDATPNAQKLPPGIEYLFPNQIQRMRAREMRGDFNAIFYRARSTQLAACFAAGLNELAGNHAAILLRDPVDLPVSGGLIKRMLPVAQNFARGDHVPFWNAGVPAITVNDTANFRYPHYHRATDTPDKLDYTRIAALVGATACAIAASAGQSAQP